MNNIVEEFQDALRHDEYDEDVLYEAFLTGWDKRDQRKMPAAPHRIYNDDIPERVIREYFELGWKRGHQF